ncbi:MAG: hypothetical protein EAZ63_03820 [Runella slithyformis]|nr:MAG: hypothetical protein EAZ63_03820 [Runella slithyformis]
MSSRIFIDGQEADLPVGGLNFVLEKYSPIFNFSEIRGTKTSDFTLPLTAKNRRIFGHYDNPQFGQTGKLYRCEKMLDGQVIERGFVALKEASNNGFNLYFTQNLGEIFGDFQDVTLNKIDFGSEPLAGFVPPVNPVLSTAKYCFPQVVNPTFYGTNTQSGWNGYMNQYTLGAYNAHARVPMFFVHWVLKQCATLCDFTFKGAFMDDPTMQRLIFYNTFSLDDASTLTYANHLPELSLRALLKELRLMFNLYLDFDVATRTLTIDYADSIMATATTRNWTVKANDTKVRVPEINNRLELDWELDGGDELMKVIPANFEKYQTADNGGGRLFGLKTRLSTLSTDSSGLAMTRQVGISPRFSQGNNRFAARLLFWNGLVAGVPTATAAHGNYRLAWHGVNNLRSRFWDNYEAWRGRTFQVRRPLLLSASDLAAWDFRNKIHVKGVDYYVDSIKPQLPLRGSTEAVLWRA